jgi:exodeoxyribonuclease VII large subunit
MDEPLFSAIFETSERRPLTVSELNAEVRGVLEKNFRSVWVEGEVVNFTAAASGHWYFNLNDGDAQIRCVCWKGTNYRIRFRPENGITVRVRGRLTLYEVRGEFQLVVESLEPSGEGALALAFAQIRSKLDAEGLFAPELKRPLPFFPRRVGVVTSKSGAAFHDIVNVLTRRAQTVSIVLAPATVQGEGAADSIRRAVENLNLHNSSLPANERIDVLIVGRGGGSAEDLWAFNDEMLARAVRASEIPVISAVGHEIDWTICDLIADERAATPSAAAEMVAAREEDIHATLRMSEDKLVSAMNYFLLDAGARLSGLSSDLRANFLSRAQSARLRFANAASRLTPATLRARAAKGANSLAIFSQRASTAMTAIFNAKTESMNVAMAKLDALSPLAVLTRGYSITQTADARILRDPTRIRAGDKLSITLEKGKLDAEVLPSE